MNSFTGTTRGLSCHNIDEFYATEFWKRIAWSAWRSIVFAKHRGDLKKL